ncbi:hypothetical protein D0Z07_0803 [Hyphodiscus hymeniophilus]|uniref:Uncharacterized protein n=1 Tax=Hyphodiscus hymeniophilus TaxID=353542 RepID=A0A9P6VPJ8_9HELO|nr:hypothetical protein D0Z07_0803 [Hyphodiscus hymeniophilus]
MAEETPTRFDRLIALTPRRFHISSEPPFGVGLVLCGHVNADDDDGSQFFMEHNGIRNCKPGIWTSLAVFSQDEGGEEMTECVLRWVEDGSIDLAQDVKQWEEYEGRTRKLDAESFKSVEGMVGKDGKVLEWKRKGTYYDDGGVCNVVSTEYLTRAAFEKIVDAEQRADLEEGYGFYVETLTLSAFDGPPGNERFCIGGMSFGQDEVGGPPRVSVAEENGQVVAVRIHGGEDEEDEEAGEDEEDEDD